MNHPIMFLDRENKTTLVPASFFYFLELYERKVYFNVKSVVVINNRFNLCFIKKLIKLFLEIQKASKNNQSSWKAI